MKRTIKILTFVTFLMLTGYNVYRTQSNVRGLVDFCLAKVEALANGEELTGNCSISYDCLDEKGYVDGSVSCSGTNYCKRGVTSEGILWWEEEYRWVECDGNRTSCKPETEQWL